ncbi:MAG: threonine-phosphate decarboxylase CobD [Gammaproteobacteria bacterium]|nr:threonine-phosphate decarboxylase CobD [Gammaproteobacteria bacterium]
MTRNIEFKPEGLKHGGRILAAAKKYTIPVEQWLDLSTGLNPNGWPVPTVPASVWQALPEDDDGLQAVACEYYGCEYCLPVAGSQAAIQTLPALRSLSKVGIISPTYAEHEYNWQQAGHDVIALSLDNVEMHIKELDVLVVVNPNNPTGKLIEKDMLLEWHEKLSTRGGWLVVDEAFIDVRPETSLVTAGILPGLIILRSMGKFFGLAGIRCGFVISDRELLQRISNKLGPWQLSGPTRYIAKQALQDKAWQESARKELIESSKRLSDTLKDYGLLVDGSTAFFQWLNHPSAEEIFEACAGQGILIRLFEKTTRSSAGLRFGLPKNEIQWQKLKETLATLPYLNNTNKKKNVSYV